MRIHHRAITTLAGLLVVLVPRVGSPHIGPSERENNRYIKLSPAGDRIRMVYTVYMGQQPGAADRRRMDANGDGVLGEDEADAYGERVATEVKRQLELHVDGSPYPLSWNEIHVGLGTPSVDAGAFSVDLVAWLCLERPHTRTSHDLVLRDHFQVPRPGEGELRIESAPGVEILRSTLGEDGRHSQMQFKWFGGAGPLEELGYYLELAVDPDRAAMASNGPCSQAASDDAAPTGGRDRKRTIAAAIAAAAIVGLLVLVVVRARRRRGT